jgi:hypothetical protein
VNVSTNELTVAFLNKGFGTTLAAGATALLSLSFVFAATAQEVLGSCIFLFVKHPYDVGDRVDVEKRPLVVERIALLFTVFRCVTDHKTIQVPNIVLNSNWIENITRSKAMREQVVLAVNFDTSFADIQLLRSEMQKFVLDKDNCREFQPDVDIEVIGLAEMNKLELKIEIRHKSNWSNETVRAARRSKFMCALVLAIRKIPMYGPGGGDATLGDVGKPSYSVAISQEQAQANREEFATNKEKKRMVPTSEVNAPKPPEEHQGKASGSDCQDKSSGSAHYRGHWGSTRSSTVANSEVTCVEALNSRPPAMDQARVDESDILREKSVSSPDRAGHPHTEMDDDRPLTRETSKGRRPTLVSPSVPTIDEPGPSHQGSKEYYEYATPYTSSTGRDSPYQSNNPYARSSPPATSQPPHSPQSQQQQQPQPQQSQGYHSRTESPVPPGAQQSPATRRPAQTGNAFAQQQQRQRQQQQ